MNSPLLCCRSLSYREEICTLSAEWFVDEQPSLNLWSAKWSREAATEEGRKRREKESSRSLQYRAAEQMEVWKRWVHFSFRKDIIFVLLMYSIKKQCTRPVTNHICDSTHTHTHTHSHLMSHLCENLPPTSVWCHKDKLCLPLVISDKQLSHLNTLTLCFLLVEQLLNVPGELRP